MDSVNLPINKRLLVLLPESLAGNIPLAHHINWMAGLQTFDVLYLVVVEEETNPLNLSRQMTTMVAATIGEPLHVSSRIISRKHWLNTLRETIEPGDLLVCQAEQSVKTAFFQALSMQEYLQDVIQIPCRSISGYYHPGKESVRKLLFGLLFWLGALAIMLGFTVLEINIDQTLQGVARIILLFLAVGFELGLLMAWTRIPKF